MNDKKLFLLDAYALIFRAYYALIHNPQFSRSGMNTSAIFGFVNTLEELLRKENPSHMAVCFDPPGPTFRHEELESYKGERESTPEDIKLSVPFIKEIVRAYNIPIVEVAGYEADDVIGTLSQRAAREGYTVYMMTPDKDFGQLVGPGVFQYKPSYRGQDMEIRGENEVCARYGIENTSQVIDLLALMGDKADNIPGCPGVGEKTAVKLLGEFHSVENLLANTESLKGALKRKVEEGRESILLSKHLATICTDVPVDVTPDDLKVKRPDTDKLFAIFKELDFNRLGERVRKRLDAPGEGKADVTTSRTASFTPSLFDEDESPRPVAAELPSAQFHCVRNLDDLDVLERRIAEADTVGIYTRTSGESDYSAHWTGTAVSFPDGETYYVPCSFPEGHADILDLFANPDILKVTSSAKRDWILSARESRDRENPLTPYYDITLAHYLIQPEYKHDIGELADSYLGLMLPPEFPAKKTQPLAEESVVTAVQARAFAVLKLREPLGREIDRGGLQKLLDEIEMPLAGVLARMEMAGVRIDVDALNMAAERFSEKLAGLERRIHELAGGSFNVSSPAQTGEVLFGRLALDPKAKKTRSGQYSTSETVLEKLVPKHPVVALILEYRGIKKLLTTYLTALPGFIDPRTGKIHTTYNQTATATGRLSSTNPNLQNIPVRDDEGREIRRAFIADKGCRFLSADYSQIELRLVADMAGDDTMINAFVHNRDIHAITAAKIYGLTPEEVTAAQRRNAKTANFGILYGISPFGLSNRLNIPRAEAKMLIDGYHASFPAVSRYMEETIAGAREKGYVTTISGRKRMQPDINSSNAVVRGYAERNAVNAPVQGSAADVIKKAMIDIDAEIRRRGLKSRMIMQVHDELNFNVPDDEVDTMRELVTRLMEGAYKGRVTLTAACGVADNWLDAH